MKAQFRNLLENPRTTAVAVLAILGAIRDPSALDADKIEIILLAIGLIFARDAGSGKTNG